MALAVNQQFNRFVEFAQGHDLNNARNMDKIARVGDPAGGLLAGRTIKTAEGDGLRKLSRSDELQRENNLARKLFRQSVIDIFGGLSNVPDSVKEAMKLKDYDQGKPLTVRRILAVKTAIDVYSVRASEAFDRAKEAAMQTGLYTGPQNAPVDAQKRAKIDSLLATAVNAAVTDVDALEIVAAHGRQILISSTAKLRTEEKVKERVAEILANVAELKAAAKGNSEILRLGLDFLKEMGGKSLPTGMIGTIVRMTAKQDIGAMKKLSPASSSPSLHKAVGQLIDNRTKAMEAANVDKADLEVSELRKVRYFCFSLQVARLGGAAVQGIKSLLDAKGGILAAFYNKASSERGLPIPDLDPVIRDYMRPIGEEFATAIEAFYGILQFKLGIHQDDLQTLSNGNHDYRQVVEKAELGGALFDRAEALMRKDWDAYLKTMVVGKGRSVGKLHEVFDKAFPNFAYEPRKQFLDAMSKNICGRINRNLCKSRKDMQGAGDNPQESRFNNDFKAMGLFDVVMPDGTRLERDDAVYDKLASFVTNGAKTAFAALDEHEKKKLCILISLLDATSLESAEDGGKLALDPNGRDDGKIAPDGNLSTKQFKLSFDSENTVLVIQCNTKRELAGIRLKNEEGAMENVNTGPGSKLEAVYALRIPVGELDRLAELDFSTYDDEPVRQRIENPNIRNPYRNIGPTFGQGFAFAPMVRCFSNFKLTVN